MLGRMKSVTTEKVALRSGDALPVVGLGVWKAGSGEETRGAVRSALRHGYRHVDTARIYGNEADVGAAIAASGIPRQEIFVTTKLWNADQGYDSALKALDASLKRLGLDYVDLYLIHWPVDGKRKDSWRALERQRADGKARAIGVSNYLVPHLQELEGYAKELPSVDQIEIHPELQQRETRAYCAARGIVVEAYSPLGSGALLSHPVVNEVAKAIGKSAAQVLLRWGLQHDLVVLPKSVRDARIAENAALFDFTLDAAAMARLDGLEAGRATGWDPRTQK
jgi:diketogulonate reductase-like aldo/keto reductase